MTTNQKIYLHTPAPDLQASLNFYEMVGFQITRLADNLHLLQDKQMALLLNSRPEARLGYCCYTDDYYELSAKFGDKTETYASTTGTVLADPNGVRLYLYPIKDIMSLPESPATNNLCGVNFGTGIETTRFQESLSFWSLLGYQPNQPVNKESQYTTTTSEGGPAITFFKPGNCPHAFYNPSLTYFNGKEGNPIVIDNLRKKGIKPKEEITVFNPKGEVDNIIISDPGGLHSFIYNDG